MYISSASYCAVMCYCVNAVLGEVFVSIFSYFIISYLVNPLFFTVFTLFLGVGEKSWITRTPDFVHVFRSVFNSSSNFSRISVFRNSCMLLMYFICYLLSGSHEYLLFWEISNIEDDSWKIYKHELYLATAPSSNYNILRTNYHYSEIRLKRHPYHHGSSCQMKY